MVSLLNLFVDGHKELMFPDSSSKEVEGLKAHYKLAKPNMASFERGCSMLHSCLNGVSSFLDEVKNIDVLLP